MRKYWCQNVPHFNSFPKGIYSKFSEKVWIGFELFGITFEIKQKKSKSKKKRTQRPAPLGQPSPPPSPISRTRAVQQPTAASLPPSLTTMRAPPMTRVVTSPPSTSSRKSRHRIDLQLRIDSPFKQTLSESHQPLFIPQDTATFSPQTISSTGRQAAHTRARRPAIATALFLKLR